MWSNVFIKHDKYELNNTEYDFFKIEDKTFVIGKKVKFYILEEDIYSQDIVVDNGRDINKKIDELVISEFNEDSNYLLDNIRINKNTYRVYAVKCGYRLEKLWDGEKINKVIPIQYCMNKKILSKVKESYFSIILEYEDFFYLINYKDKIIVNSDVSSSLEFLLEKSNGGNIYYDSKVAEKINYHGKKTVKLGRKGKGFEL